MPTLSVSVAEEEVRGIGADVMAGHLVAWNYYQTTETPANETFVAAYKAKYGANRVTDDPIEAGYIGVYLWAAAVEKAGSIDVDKVQARGQGHRTAMRRRARSRSTARTSTSPRRSASARSEPTACSRKLWNSGSRSSRIRS